jgi:hypothetical protein
MTETIVTIRPARDARTPYAEAWHVARPQGGTLCNGSARTKPVTAKTPVITCQKCNAQASKGLLR